MSRSTSQSSSAAGSASNGLTRNTSVKTNIKPVLNPNLLATSDVKLFITNLRLLDLDLLDDWPSITLQTFSSKNADQKQRIGGVEWALFRLFERWDPEETSQRLQPFFPPLEPLQSLNLRAALYRCLNDLKKNGVLGRESVLRKSMLDECKGEKFYEILSLFSTAVLKKVLSAERVDKRRMAVSRKMAIATSLSNSAQSSLLPLAIAHKAALVNVLRQKDEKRRKFLEFEKLLQAKADEITERNKSCRATPRSKKAPVTHVEAADIKKQLKDSWIGNQKWLDVMLHGDGAQVEDAFLQRPFDQVWYMVQKGREVVDATPDAGLMENLELRVQEQRAGLRNRQAFHEKMQKSQQGDRNSSSSSRTAERSLKEFDFHAHLDLRLSPAKSTVEEHMRTVPLRPAYQDIISDMDGELERVAQAKRNRSAPLQLTRRGSSFSSPRSPVRNRSSRSDIVSKNPKAPPSPVRTMSKEKFIAQPLKEKLISQSSREKFLAHPPLPEPTTTPIDSDATLIGHSSTTLRGAPVASHPVESPMDSPHEALEETSDPLPATQSPSPPPPVPVPTTRPRSPSPPPSSYFPSEPPVFEPPFQNAEDALAEQIISSIGNATPSPVKNAPRLSLVERTRMSMAHTSAFAPITESPHSADSPPLPSPLDIEPPQPQNRRVSLLERTRLSMANMSAQQRPPARKEKRKSTARQTLYPVNQFDTPRNRKSIQIIEDQKSGGSTPKEDLFSDDIDYERVFKSRPRVAQSPVFSPDVTMMDYGHDEEGNHVAEDVSRLDIDDGFEEGVTGVDLDDVDADEDADGFTQAWADSPLRMAGGKRSGRLFG